jgi:hypothetical protein
MVRTSYVISGRDLRIRPRNRPGPGEPVDPDNPDNPGIPGPYPPDYEDAEHPELPVIPAPPPHMPAAPGLYVGPTKGNPVIPVPPEPEEGEGEHVELPPGAIWPKRARGRVAGNYVALAYVPEHGWHYVVIDPDAWPDWEKAEHPESPTVPEPATRRTTTPTQPR